MRSETVQKGLPAWLPVSVERYVAHTEQGVSIRALARRDGCHASTVLRQIRKLEMMRDDPLVDAALDRFRDRYRKSDAMPLWAAEEQATELPEEADLRQDGARILRQLSTRGAVLAVASDMENAVVVGEGGARKAVVARQVAQAMALKSWIHCTQPGRISRYVITPAGRAALSQMVAERENSAQGFAESPQDFGTPQVLRSDRAGELRGLDGSARFSARESPLATLARRKEKDGSRFLDDAMVHAGERFREDFELAQMGTHAAKEWAGYLAAPDACRYQPAIRKKDGAEAARERIVAALTELGPGLGDVVLRCCCYLEGLETAERSLGWSARSGKIVLRIALMRLRDHYLAHAGGAGDYIG